jgi:diguanylate cyclase (GGDEF)-like protein
MSSRSKVSLGRRAIVLTSVDGSSRSLDVSATPRTLSDGAITGVVVVLRDVTELRGMARQMSYQASHDALTGLVNRREFERRLGDKLVLAHQGVQTHVLCYLDLDGFKVVNDTSGHVAGDNVLREVAGRLRNAVRDSDTVARIGGDEFAILLGGCPLHKAAQIADTVVTSIRDYRFVWKNSIFTIAVGVGLVELGRESGDIEEVMTAADSACYVAKSRGRGQVHVYSARDEAAARGRGEIQWLHRLQQALKEGLFLLYTQSIIATEDDARPGPAMEVLVRLAGEHGAVIAPSEFIGAAERYRLMTLVDRWVVQHVLAAIGRGAITLPPGRSVSINISAQSLGDAEFLDFMVDCFDHSSVDPALLCFEVTEAAVVANIDHARRFIEVLHGLGATFALDDFGSGLGSLAHLKSLPMDFLKIDGVYMRELHQSEVNRAMVTAMIELGRTLGFRLIAEQVEDAAAMQTARRMGVDFLQGFAISRPQPLKTSV